MRGISVGDAFMQLLLDGSGLQASALKEGQKAGDSAGAAMSEGIKGRLGDLFKGSTFLGVGIELGRQLVQGLETAVTDVINVIPDMIAKGQAFAVTVHDIEEATGGGAVQASHFAGAIQYVTGSVDGLGPKLKAFSEAIHNNEATFKTWGITTRDSSGAWLNTLDILDNAREMFSTKLPAGVSKSDMAIKLFGRTGLDFLDFLGLSNADLAALNQTLDASGYTLSDTSGQEAAKREWNLFDMVLQGLDNTLSVQLLPTIREVLAAATNIIVTDGKQITAVLTDITQSVLGFITDLLVPDAAVPFQAQLDGLGTSVEHVTLTKQQWADANGRLIPTIDEAAAATKAATTAIDNEVKSIDKQIERSKAADTAAENAFGHTMTRLGAVYQAQLDALDLQDKQDAAAQKAHDLNEQLNQAQLDLAKAQAGDKGVVDAEAVSSAMKAVADVRAEQAKNTLQEQRDAERASLQSTKDFIAEQATLAGDTTVTQTTKIKTFTQREGALTSSIDVAKEKGDAATVADLTARLEAVRTAKARTEQATRALDRQAELGDIKARLEDQRAALAAADSSEVTANKKALAQLNADYAAYLAEQTATTTSWLVTTHDAILGDPKTGTGLGGAFSKSFGEGKAAAEDFKKFVDEELLPSLRTILDVTGKIAGVLTTHIDTDSVGSLLGLAGISKLFGLTSGPGALAALPLTLGGDTAVSPADEMSRARGNLAAVQARNTPKHIYNSGTGETDAQAIARLASEIKSGNFTNHGYVAGGLAGRSGRELSWLGERRPEYVIPDVPDAAARLDAFFRGPMSGMWAGGKETIEVPVYLDGDVITRVVAQRLADDYRR